MSPGDTVYLLDRFNFEGAFAENRPELVIAECKVSRVLGNEIVAFDAHGYKHLVKIADVATSRDQAKTIAGRWIREDAARRQVFAGLVEAA